MQTTGPTRDDVLGTRVDLYWLPLGAGDGSRCVRGSGAVYEAVSATWHRRRRRDLYHSALQVQVGDGVHAIEMAPVWSETAPDRGVVAEGPVGLRLLGGLRLFRYEIRCWLGGIIPDLADAVGGPTTVSHDPDLARRVLALVPSCPLLTWGRDELGTGEMWSSNSLVGWLLARSGHDTRTIGPPPGGRAPGWHAGCVAGARRAQDLGPVARSPGGTTLGG